MSRAQPNTLLYFVARTDYAKAKVVVDKYNLLLEKAGNMLLLAPVRATQDIYNPNRYIFIFPLNFGFPFVLWPLCYIPRVVYSFSLIVACWRVSVRLRPISSRYALAVVLNGGEQ